MNGYVPAKFGDRFFDDIKDFIADQCDPDEVYGWKALTQWVEANSKDLGVYTSEDVDAEIAEYIKNNNYIQEE